MSSAASTLTGGPITVGDTQDREQTEVGGTQTGRTDMGGTQTGMGGTQTGQTGVGVAQTGQTGVGMT